MNRFWLGFAMLALLLISCETQPRRDIVPKQQYLQYLSPTDVARLDRAAIGDAQAIHEVFQKNVNGNLDGENGELYATSLLDLERRVGRKRFVAALSRETKNTRLAVTQFLLPLVSDDADLKESLRAASVPP